MAESLIGKKKMKLILSDHRKKVHCLEMAKEDMEIMVDAIKIFQDGAYEDELEIKKWFQMITLSYQTMETILLPSSKVNHPSSNMLTL